jgi:hypothetical protein
MGTTTSTDDDAYTAQREAARANIIQRESGGQNIFSSAGDPNMPKEQKGSGYYQFIPSSWREAANIAGIDTSKYPLAIDAPRTLQDQAFNAYYAKYGERPWAQSAPGNARAQMASTDTGTDDTTAEPTSGLLGIPALSATDAQLRDTIRKMNTSVGGGDNSKLSWAAKIGNAVGGGQGNLSGQDAEDAGTRSLMNFGMGLLANSGYHPIRTTMGEALAAGLQGAQASELGSQQLQRDTVQKALGYLQEQQRTGIQAGELGVKQQELAWRIAQLKAGQAAAAAAARTALGGPPATPVTPAIKTGPAEVAPADVMPVPPIPPEGGPPASTAAAGDGALPVPPVPPEGGPPAATAKAPDGTPIGKAGAFGSGKLLKSDAGTPGDQVATDVAFMQQGRQLAQGAPALTARTAGPGAPTGGISPEQQAIIDKIQPQPGWPGAPAAQTPPTEPATASPPPPGTSATIPPPVTSNGVTISHPGNRGDYIVQHTMPTPTTGIYDPNLPPEDEARYRTQIATALQANANNPDEAQKQISTAQQEHDKAIAARRQLAQENVAKFEAGQLDTVGKQYDTQLGVYNDAVKGKFATGEDIIQKRAASQDAANQKMLEPYQVEATKAAQMQAPLSQLHEIMPMLPVGSAAMLDSQDNRDKLAKFGSLVGLPPGWEGNLKGAEMWQKAANGVINQAMQQDNTGVMAGKSAAIAQLRDQLPGLSQTQEGREMTLLMLQELGDRKIAENTFMQQYHNNDANLNPTLKVPDMSGAVTAMGKALPPMLKLPPPDVDPNAEPSPQSKARYQTYWRNMPEGGKYIGFDQDQTGRWHPAVRVKAKGETGPQLGVQ